MKKYILSLIVVLSTFYCKSQSFTGRTYEDVVNHFADQSEFVLDKVDYTQDKNRIYFSYKSLINENERRYYYFSKYQPSKSSICLSTQIQRHTYNLAKDIAFLDKYMTKQPNESTTSARTVLRWNDYVNGTKWSILLTTELSALGIYVIWIEMI